MGSPKEHKECKKCNAIFSYTPEETFWDDHGSGYSTKLCLCPYCGCVNVIEHIEDVGNNVNYDLRFYEYRKTR